MTTIWARKPRLRISRAAWRNLATELGRRSGGTREAGAFLLGHRRRHLRRVVEVVYYDDLDPTCLVGNIHLSGSAYGPLWARCRDTGLTVLADVHTHGGTYVTQSSIDAANPMVATTGHLAMIVPHLAQQPYAPAQVGLHEYLGEPGWRTWTGRHTNRRIKLRRKP